MGIQDYQIQILNFFKKNFIEDNRGDTNELADVIREKLMLIDDSAERKSLVTSVLDEIHEISLIHKYKNLYSTNNHQSTNSLTPNVVEYLSYNFRRMI